MTENSKKIDKLLRLAKDVDEPTFQRKSQYQSFKSKKGITPSEIQRFIDGIESILFSTLHKYLVCPIEGVRKMHSWAKFSKVWQS